MIIYRHQGGEIVAKKRTTFYLEEKIYKKYQMLCLIIGKSVSEEILKFMEEQVEKWEKED